jgi:hypothetical protein
MSVVAYNHVTPLASNNGLKHSKIPSLNERLVSSSLKLNVLERIAAKQKESKSFTFGSLTGYSSDKNKKEESSRYVLD